MKSNQICLVCAKRALQRVPDCGMDKILSGDEQCKYQGICDIHKWYQTVGLLDDEDVAKAMFFMDEKLPYELKLIFEALEQRLESARESYLPTPKNAS